MHVDVCVKEGSNTDLQQKYFWVSVYEEILKISIFLPNFFQTLSSSGTLNVLIMFQRHCQMYEVHIKNKFVSYLRV